MKDSRKYETIVGIFVVASLAVLMIMVFIIARQEGLFQKYVEYKALFKNVSGLKPGSEVHLAGVTVGNVRDITINPDGTTEVIFHVIKKYSDRVREDSQASIGFMGLLGEKSLDLSAGTAGKAPIPPGGPVAVIEPLDVTQLLAKAGPSLEDLQRILHNLAEVTGGWTKEGDGNLKKILEQALEILTKINEGKGTLGLAVNDPKLYHETIETIAKIWQAFNDVAQGKGAMGILVHDPKFKAQMQRTMENLEASTGILNKSSADLKETTVGLPGMMKKADTFLDSLQKAGKSLPELFTEAETTISDADKAAKAAQKSWLLRRNVPKPKEHTIRMDADPGKD